MNYDDDEVDDKVSLKVEESTWKSAQGRVNEIRCRRNVGDGGGVVVVRTSADEGRSGIVSQEVTGMKG